MWPFLTARPRPFLPLLALLSLALLLTTQPPAQEAAASTAAPRQINIPRFTGSTFASEETAVLWFGQVDHAANYADVRLGYNDDKIKVTLHIFDEHLWYDTSPTANTLTQWDAATLYLHKTAAGSGSPNASSYRFDAQLTHFEARPAYQKAYRGSSGAWTAVSIPFDTTVEWRGDAPNTPGGDRGWLISFNIPFASLGASAPAAGTEWRLGLALHDRDDAAGPPNPTQTWPEALNSQQPSAWGILHFGMPAYTPPLATPGGRLTLRHGLHGTTVVDAPVGGGTMCGDPAAPGYFGQWGSLNYAGDATANVQNQWDVADWPCFSKFYVSFPTTSLPAGKVILSASLRLHLFGSASPGDAQPSLLQVFELADPWDEASLTWNNAPLAQENVAAAWVDPAAFPGWPGIPYDWDVTRAVAAAHAAGEPVNLALYSADGAYHSGKYFSTSEAGDWNAVARPTLIIEWGEPVAITYDWHAYLPAVRADN
ncbi:MAG: DNRLRE domain-containing protein [Anaerolineales bacterium]|nr:DNRLRE domain-containing protein [Anaerolineales bacterium]